MHVLPVQLSLRVDMYTRRSTDNFCRMAAKSSPVVERLGPAAAAGATASSGPLILTVTAGIPTPVDTAVSPPLSSTTIISPPPAIIDARLPPDVRNAAVDGAALGRRIDSCRFCMRSFVFASNPNSRHTPRRTRLLRYAKINGDPMLDTITHSTASSWALGTVQSPLCTPSHNTNSPYGRYETRHMTTTRTLMRAARDSSRYLKIDEALERRCRMEDM